MTNRGITQESRLLVLREFEHLLDSAPDYGEISFKASVHQGDVGRLSVGIEKTRKFVSQVREGLKDGH